MSWRKSLSRNSHAITPYLTGSWFRLALVAIMLIIYVLDLSMPLGVPVWLLYGFPLILAFWSKAPYAIPAVCAVTILFLASGFVYSPPGIEVTVGLVLRIIFAVGIIGTSAALWMVLRRQGIQTPGNYLQG